MKNFLQVIEDFEPITLSEMGRVMLLNRTDVKYVFHREKLYDILLLAKDSYRSLVINERPYADYSTTYFDTPNYQFYLDHHNKRLNRYKLRTRSYVNSDLHFFEIKFKSNKGRTIKSRVRIPQATDNITEEAAEFLKSKTGIEPDILKKSIQIDYKRITLVNKELTERITIDFDLTYKLDDIRQTYPDMIIIEVKQNRANKSRFTQIMHEQHLHNTSLSKYCFGIASYVEGVKRNNFKKQILYVKKISNQAVG